MGPASVSAGEPFPQGASVRPDGVNFALFSKHASRVTLCLFDRPGDVLPSVEIPLQGPTKCIWHARVSGVSPGQLYGYRVDGRYDPLRGHRFNRNKLLLDPYAKALCGKYCDASGECLAYDQASEGLDLSFDTRDSSGSTPKCVVMDDAFPWENDAHPHTPMEESVIYEVHVKGFTAHPSSGVEKPGTYSGMVEKIPYLAGLGVTAVELLPVHESVTDGFLSDKGLVNYWGYNTIGYFAPDSRFASSGRAGAAVGEFKAMVKAFHRAGMEVLLDVVYNHTAEGNHLGPTYSFKGVDNSAYYALSPENRRYYMDWTGCGNSLNFDDPQVVRLVMDSLRYWVEVMHVDGFRFDLATVLGREKGRFDQVSAFFMTVHQDPVLSCVKLIAEPWDTGFDSYQVGNFPVDWSEWNGRYRDCVRRFIKSDPGQVGELAMRLAGSPDLFGDDGRRPYNSVNFITSHDGFTLRDLVTYSRKHNEANGERGRDGADDNCSWNCGVEGETDDIGVRGTRRATAKNAMAILMVSQGSPMLLGGDEFLRSQGGNNNAYCQDNPTSWFNWDMVRVEADFLAFCKGVIALRKRHPSLHKKSFFFGEDRDGDRVRDITWFGENLGGVDWSNPEKRCLALRIQGKETLLETGEREDDIVVLLNGHWNSATFLLPPSPEGQKWARAVDTRLPPGDDVLSGGKGVVLSPQDSYVVSGRSVVVLVASPA